MKIAIKILQAFNGDSILISFKDEDKKNRNILIDGGTGKSYQYKSKKKGSNSGDLKLAIEKIKKSNEKIDLLILTHVDDDHIGGIIKWMEADTEALVLVGKIWFNSGKIISEHFKQELEHLQLENLLPLRIRNGTYTSIKQGAYFEDFIAEHKAWERKIIRSKEVLLEFGVEFKFLSPNVKNLEKLLNKWKKEKPETLTSGKGNDYKETLTELIENDKFEEDKSVHNGSSIAFILTCDSKNILFLGDAFPTTVIEGLHYFGYSERNPLKAELVKVSHHGSKSNTNYELLSIIDCGKFIISSNGSNIHNLPNKKCLARIIKSKSDVKLYFNYPEIINEIFLEEDFNELRFKALPCDEEFII